MELVVIPWCSGDQRWTPTNRPSCNTPHRSRNTRRPRTTWTFTPPIYTTCNCLSPYGLLFCYSYILSLLSINNVYNMVWVLRSPLPNRLYLCPTEVQQPNQAYFELLMQISCVAGWIAGLCPVCQWVSAQWQTTPRTVWPQLQGQWSHTHTHTWSMVCSRGERIALCVAQWCFSTLVLTNHSPTHVYMLYATLCFT